MEQNQALAENAGDAFSNTFKIMYSQANDGRNTVTGTASCTFAFRTATAPKIDSTGADTIRVDNVKIATKTTPRMDGKNRWLYPKKKRQVLCKWQEMKLDYIVPTNRKKLK